MTELERLKVGLYLGDGVYASFDGYQIILDLRGQDNFTKIALESQVLDALDRFRDRISQAFALQAKKLEEEKAAKGRVIIKKERGRT